MQWNYENGFEDKLRSGKPSQYICTKKAKCNYEGGKTPLEFEEVFDNFKVGVSGSGNEIIIIKILTLTSCVMEWWLNVQSGQCELRWNSRLLLGQNGNFSTRHEVVMYFVVGHLIM